MVRARRFDNGETLIEIVVSITILSIAAVALLAGLSLAIKASAIHRSQTTGGAYVRSYAEAIEKYVGGNGSLTSNNYKPCAALTDYSAATLNASTPSLGVATPSGFNSPTVIEVQSVSPTGILTPTAVDLTDATMSGVATSACSPSTDTGVQALTLRVASSSGQASERLTILIRNPCVGTGSDPCSS